MTYWDVLARDRANRETAAALSPILRAAGPARPTPVFADADRTIAALRETIADQAREIARLKAELAARH